MVQIDQITDEAQVRFQPPDEDWRTYVSNLQRNALNVYLVGLRENCKLRFLGLEHSSENCTVTEKLAPVRYRFGRVDR